MSTTTATNRFMRRRVAIGLTTFSILATTVGFLSLVAFDEAPGLQHDTPKIWPALSGIGRSPHRADLLVFVHPFCSCTRATLFELTTLMGSQTGFSDRFSLVLVVVRPAHSSWKIGESLEMVSKLPHARLVWDDGGTEARRFRAVTSGFVALYDASGALRFHGGVTGSRGHEGDNYGLQELEATLRTDAPSKVPSPNNGEHVRTSRVYGCSLIESESPAAAVPSRWCSSPTLGGLIRRAFCAS